MKFRYFLSFKHSTYTMKHFRLFLIIIFLTCSLESFSQLLPQTQYVFNPYLYNPALAGAKGDMAFYLSYKKQWWGIEGAPDLATLTFEFPFENRVSLSSQLNYQTEGPLSLLNWFVTGSYFIPLDSFEEHFLFFGMSVGVENRAFNMSEVSDPNDPALANATALSHTGIIGNVGLAYTFKGFRAGFSLPRLFAQDVITVDDDSFENTSNQLAPMDYWIANLSYRYNTTFSGLGFEPQILYHADKFAGNQIEGMLTFYYQDYGYVGASYRQGYGVSAYLGGNINEMLSVNYVYGFSSTADANLPFNNATHELGVRVNLGNKRGSSEGASQMDWLNEGEEVIEDQKDEYAPKERKKKNANYKKKSDDWRNAGEDKRKDD